MALEAGLQEIGGQLVYDKPYHCGLCRRRYRRRVLILGWAREQRATGTTYKRVHLRLCVSDEQATGCVNMGFKGLFKDRVVV